MHIGETQVQVARQALVRVAVEIDVIEALLQSCIEMLAQTAQADALFWPQVLRQLTGFAKAYNTWDIQRARTETALLSTAIDQRVYTDALGTRFTDIESPNALGTIELMPRE